MRWLRAFGRERGSERERAVDFEAEIERFALREENRERFATLLNRILPDYTRWTWGRDDVFRRHFNEWQRNGFSLLPNHYYSPVPDVHGLGDALGRRTSLPGVDLRTEAQLELLRKVCPLYAGEYAAFPDGPTGVPGQFHFANGAFERVDAEMLHLMVRHHRPARMIEVGSGYSTLVSAAACERNARDGHPCRFVAIEPQPNDLFLRPIAGLQELLRATLQEVGTAPFEELGEGDILFIDSSHVLKTGSDVQLLYLEVLPRLRPGVVVHVHDVFLPGEYPADWIRNEHVFWNEQYLLQAFLAFNSAFEVLLAASFLHLEHPDVLVEVFPGYSPRKHRPGSFWMQRRPHG
ncbi:MAG TPA: class I SAM-dependent methyltransferase [Myxococcota bacterium]|nr:class I SAM-dependent methyltransferase [Myxococcota bacterium]